MKLLAAAAIIAISGAAFAQASSQPYAELKGRQIKALSEQQVESLKAGRGMGLAMPAELNGYPGPMHTLEHADELRLKPEQLTRTKALYAEMKAEAVALGERLIREEAHLDHLFSTKTVTLESLEAATSAIGATQAKLRASHLRYHLAMMEILSPEQVLQYAQVRGYQGGHGEHGAHKHGHRHGAH